MEYISFSAEDRQELLGCAIIQREQEIAQYALNVENYTLMIAALPTGDCPPDADAIEADEYKYRDDLQKRLVAERVQMGRSRRVLDGLLVLAGADSGGVSECIARGRAKLAELAAK